VLWLFLAYLTDVSGWKACRCCVFRNCQWYMPVCLASETLSPNLLNNKYADNKYCTTQTQAYISLHFPSTPHTRMWWTLDLFFISLGYWQSVFCGSGVTAGVSRSSFVSINNLAIWLVIYCVVCLSHNFLLKSLMPSLHYI